MKVRKEPPISTFKPFQALTSFPSFILIRLSCFSGGKNELQQNRRLLSCSGNVLGPLTYHVLEARDYQPLHPSVAVLCPRLCSMLTDPQRKTQAKVVIWWTITFHEQSLMLCWSHRCNQLPNSRKLVMRLAGTLAHYPWNRWLLVPQIRFPDNCIIVSTNHSCLALPTSLINWSKSV